MCSPWSTVSSPVLTTAVMSGAGMTSIIPRSRRAAPTPPASAAIIGIRRPQAGWSSGQVSGPTRRYRRAPAMCKAPCVPPERSATSDPGRLSVGVDATPLLGAPTGVGVFCAGALGGLGARPDVDVSAFAVSWRRRHRIAALVPPGVPTAQRAMPARPLHASWGRSSLPPVEWFIGRHDVVHGTNFVVPPTRRAGRVMTVHDLTVVLYPELCDPPTLAYPDLIRRAAREGAWVHTPSRFVADQVVAELGIDPERVRAVHHGIPPAPIGASRQPEVPFTLPDGCHRYVLAVGTIEPRKDYPLLVSAFGVGGRLPSRRGPGHRRGRRLGGRAVPGRRRRVAGAEPHRPPRLPRRPGPGRRLQERVGAGLPVALRGLRVPPAAGHGRRDPGGGHGRRRRPRGGG